MSDDADVIRLLSRFPGSAVLEGSSSGFVAATAAVRTHSDLIEEVFKCLRDHPDFSSDGQIFFDSAHLHIHPYTGAMSISAYAIRHGAQGAVDWYRRLMSISAAKIRHAGFVSGVSTKERFNFSNGISILPIEEAGEAARGMFASTLSGFNPLHHILGSHFNALAIKDAEYERTDMLPNPPDSDQFLFAVEDVLVGSILNDGLAPALLVRWEEFLDADLYAAETSWGTSGSTQEAAVHSGRLLMQDDIPNIELFLSVQGKFKNQLRVALIRLGLGRRKMEDANKAIDYCIALEALFGDGKSEMTHKISTRASLVLSSDFEEKIYYRNLFKKLYNIRSRAVHGLSAPQRNEREIVRESEIAIARLLIIATEHGKAFDFDKIDLSGAL